MALSREGQGTRYWVWGKPGPAPRGLWVKRRRSCFLLSLIIVDNFSRGGRLASLSRTPPIPT